MKDAGRMILGLSLGIVALLFSTSTSLGVDCTVCVNCAADPVFIQRDRRNPEMVPILRRFASREMQKEGLGIVVVFSDAAEGCCGESGEPTRTVVLLGDEGGSESVEIKGDLPPEVKTLVRAE